MDSGSNRNKIDFRWIERENIRPNPWNPNRMSPENAARLANEIHGCGIILPLVVRPLDGKFQIIDGEHRWQAASQIGLERLPCIVVEMDDQEARLKTIQLNRLRGEDDPELLARLLRELNVDLGLDQLSSRLPFDQLEIQQTIELLELKESEQSRKELEREMQELMKDRLFSVVVTEQEKIAIERAIFLAQSKATQPLRPGSALALLCEGSVSDRAVSKSGGI